MRGKRKREDAIVVSHLPFWEIMGIVLAEGLFVVVEKFVAVYVERCASATGEVVAIFRS